MRFDATRYFALTFCVALLTGCSTGTLLVVGGTAGALYYEENLVFQTSEDLLGAGQFRITIEKSRLIGDRGGELWQIFKRKATEIAEREGCSGYTVLDYSEGIESAVIAGKRVARGTIHCTGLVSSPKA